MFAQSGARSPAPLVPGDAAHGQTAALTVAHDPETVREVQEKGNRALQSILQGTSYVLEPVCTAHVCIFTRHCVRTRHAPVDVLMGSLPAAFDTDEEFAEQLVQLERENEAARAELRSASREAGTHCV